jgi:uncharacterized membrane protein YdjX (TVP38/TMEM64 family)
MMLRTLLPQLLLGLANVASACRLALHRDGLEGAKCSPGLWGLCAHMTVLIALGALFGLASSPMFRPVWGTILNLAGTSLGATAAFLIARGARGSTRRGGGGHCGWG